MFQIYNREDYVKHLSVQKDILRGTKYIKSLSKKKLKNLHTNVYGRILELFNVEYVSKLNDPVVMLVMDAIYSKLTDIEKDILFDYMTNGKSMVALQNKYDLSLNSIICAYGRAINKFRNPQLIVLLADLSDFTNPGYADLTTKTSNALIKVGLSNATVLIKYLDLMGVDCLSNIPGIGKIGMAEIAEKYLILPSVNYENTDGSEDK